MHRLYFHSVARSLAVPFLPSCRFYRIFSDYPFAFSSDGRTHGGRPYTCLYKICLYNTYRGEKGFLVILFFIRESYFAGDGSIDRRHTGVYTILARRHIFAFSVGKNRLISPDFDTFLCPRYRDS